MLAHESALFGDSESAARLAAAFAGVNPQSLMRLAIDELFKDKIALVSSFGAESAVLLHMAAEVEKSVPVIFIDTRVLFRETLAYRDELVALLGLTNVTTVYPTSGLVEREDPEDFLWAENPDRCCEIRKVLPLAEAIKGFDAWISGRKRFQAQSRSNLALFESESGRIKINPLAHWTARSILSYLETHALPRHPLVAKDYPSIGCIPCTSPVKPGEDVRAGRWRGQKKVECGLHTLPLYAGADI